MNNNNNNASSFVSIIDFDTYAVSKRRQEMVSLLGCVKKDGRLKFDFRDVRFKHLEKNVKKSIAFLLSVCESANIFGGFAVIHSNNNFMTYVGFTTDASRLEEEYKDWNESGASDTFIVLDVRRERGSAFDAYIEVFSK